MTGAEGPRRARTRVGAPAAAHQDWCHLAPALLLGAALRLWLAQRNAGLTMDSPPYVNLAHSLAHGEPAMGPARHGYSVLVALAGLVLPGRELLGRAVSFVAGLALVTLVYFLVRGTMTPRWAVLAAGLVGLHPLLAVYSAPIMTESNA